MIKLSKRLSVIASFIPDNCNMVDIGCDHGLLDIFLYQNRENIKIISSDVNSNALENARNNFKKYKVNKNISLVLSDGFDNIDMSNIDTVVISGMGAHTIVGILLKDLNKIKNVNNIIIQSNNDIDFIRKRITSIGFYILDEELVLDGGIIYTVIKFARGHKFYNFKQLYFGPVLLKKNNELFKQKKLNDLNKLKKLYSVIPKKYIFYRLRVYFKILLFK